MEKVTPLLTGQTEPIDVSVDDLRDVIDLWSDRSPRTRQKVTSVVRAFWMISGLNSTGHEIGGSIGTAVFSTIAAGTTGALAGQQAVSGIAHAFIAASLLAGVASLAAWSSSRGHATSCRCC